MSDTDERRGDDGACAAPIAKASTGIEGLDDILAGGLPVGRTTLFSGGPGAGKTVMATEFLYRGALAGEPGVIVSFEESAEQLRANAASMGMDLAACEAADTLRVAHAPVPHGAVRAGEFDIHGLLAVLAGHTEQIGARRLVLDAVDVLMRVFGDPEREREELYMLHDWVRQRGLTTVLTVKSGKGGERLYPFLDYMADCVILLDQRMELQVRTRRLTVAKYRGSAFLSNEYPCVLSAEGVVVMPVSLTSLAQKTVGEQVSSGSDVLDGLLGGGYFRGSCVLLAGASGVGKTTLACTFTRGACGRGEKVLYVGLEESRDSLLRDMSSVGIDLAPAVEAGTLNVLTAMPESMGVEQHLLRILRTLDAFAPQHLVVDAISACRRMGSERAAFDFCVRLLTTCRERGITCFYVNQADEPRDVMEITGLGLSSLVDTLIAMTYADDGRGLTRRLLVVKSRGASHSLRYHDFAIGKGGIELTKGSGARGAAR